MVRVPARRDGLVRRFTRRTLLLGILQAGGFAALATRLYQLQVIEGRRYAPLADDNRIDIKALAPIRGRILDRAGTVLAGNEESFRVSIVRSRTGNIRETLEQLSRVIPITLEDKAALSEKAARQDPGQPLVVASDISFEQVAAINLLAPQLPGVETESVFRRIYQHGRVTGHVTGYVGRVDRLALDDEPFRRLASMKVGKAGAELGFESELGGEGGLTRVEVDALGRLVRNLDDTEPLPGRDVTLAIDLKLQSRVLERLGREGRAALVALDVESGEVVALASTPAFDPSPLAERISEKEWQALVADESQPMFNRAIAGLYPPGSTFKMVTALAGLEAGLVTPSERIDCDGTYSLADQRFRCWKRQGHGRCDLHKALRESCDVYFYELAHRCGINAIAAMGRKLGLGETYDCGLPQQKKGTIPDADWKKVTFRKPWLGGETVLAGIGQGYVLTTPLQLAVMTARLAGGKAVTPRLRRHAVEGTPPVDFPRLDIAPENLELIRRAMVAVVNESGGTGGNASLSNGSPLVAGKTGTSQVSSLSTRDESGSEAVGPRDHALFVSYFPAPAPRYAIVAIVEHGGGGGATAAPLVRDVIEYILEDDPRTRSTARARPAGQEG